VTHAVPPSQGQFSIVRTVCLGRQTGLYHLSTASSETAKRESLPRRIHNVGQTILTNMSLPSVNLLAFHDIYGARSI